MIKKIKSFFNGVESLYDLSPSINNPYLKPDNQIKSTEESLRETWEQVGGYLKQAINDFDNKQKINS